MEIKLSYLKLVRSHEPDCSFGLSSDLTVVAKSLEKCKLEQCRNDFWWCRSCRSIMRNVLCFLRKSLKWWRKLFSWGLEICSVDSYLLYKMTKQQRGEQPLCHLRYAKTLVQQLTGDFHQARARASTSTSSFENDRLNGKLHNILTGVRKDCKICSQRSTPGKRHQTTYYCDTCPDKPGMHLANCYIKYHTKRNYKE
ncbi:hypothetical protein M0804_010342 [Polistes exclamans]|nr:hypothetical protein M0804_010342 [Polistes exclamans]